MPQTVTVGKTGWFKTTRRDTWWVEPLLVVIGLGAFGRCVTERGKNAAVGTGVTRHGRGRA